MNAVETQRADDTRAFEHATTQLQSLRAFATTTRTNFLARLTKNGRL
jgi:hypothetical protein